MPVKIGDVFSKLTVVAEVRVEGRKRFTCVCACGKITTPTASDLVTGNTKSCGCLRGQSNITHGDCKNRKDSSLYKRWQHMKSRCLNPNNKRYADYGGRGIQICEEWLSFSNYKRDVGNPPEGCSLDRINNDGNYEPSNVRWATSKEQSNNRRKARATKWDKLKENTNGF
jgi:hypothetical protein